MATIFYVGWAKLTLLLRESDVRALLPMGTAIDLVEEGFLLLAEGSAFNRERTRLKYPGGVVHYMAAAVPNAEVAGLKAYTSSAEGTRFVVLLFDTSRPRLLAILEGDWLGRIRTGAASGVATRSLARADARVAGIIGAGGQAETQIEALCAVRDLTLVKIFSRDAERRERLAARLSGQLECSVQAVDSAREAVAGSDIVTTITTASRPVFEGEWLPQGCHLNAAGSNRAQNCEIGPDSLRRSRCVVVDSLEQARQESGDLITAVRDGALQWKNVVELGDIIAGKTHGRRRADDITIYESQGVAVQDVMVASYVYRQATESGRGEQVHFGED